ncbi:MAG: prolyl oligopeptidase family serine peptidase [Cuniculiplasma sp.]
MYNDDEESYNSLFSTGTANGNWWNKIYTGLSYEAKMESLNFETMDASVRSYAGNETEKVKKTLQPYYERLKEELRPYVYQKLIKFVKITKTMEIFVTVENGKKLLIVNGEAIFSTDGIIVWIKVEENGDKVAFFETSGSDYGTVRIYRGKNSIYEEKGFIHDIIFAGDKFYVVKENRDETVKELNSSRNAIYLNGEYVFGKQLRGGEGVGGETFGDKVILTSGDNATSTLYEGKIDDPSSWKILKKYETEAKVLGYKDEKLCILLREGLGMIKVGETSIEMKEPVEDAVLVRDGLLVVHMRDAKSVPVLYDLDGKKLKEFSMNTPYGLLTMDSDGERALLIMGSFGITYSVFSLNGREMEMKESNVVSNFNIQEDHVMMKDEKIHYFVLKSKQETRNTLVYGYGGFNISLMPSYNNLFAYLVNNGIDVVVCNLPGGGEYGERWHKLGMRENKNNVYLAFQTVIKKLRESGRRVICYGVSNGGLLSSYTLTQIPEDLEAAIIGNPVTDLMMFHRLLAGQYWVSEYGNPDNEQDATFLRKYSAFENLKPGKYPPSFIYSRMDDDRVHPAHALKFYNRMKEYGNETYLLMGSGGHLGSGLEDMLSEISYIGSFIKMIFQRKA